MPGPGTWAAPTPANRASRTQGRRTDEARADLPTWASPRRAMTRAGATDGDGTSLPMIAFDLAESRPSGPL
jgi:hypothetical protein